MDILILLGKRIQSVREDRGLTQEELEDRTGVNAKYISAVECGQRNVTFKTLSKLARGLEVELYELLIFGEKPGSEKALKKALSSILKDSDAKTLALCLEFLKLSRSA